MKNIKWYSESIETCMHQLKTTPQGLSITESNKRLQELGFNEIKSLQERSFLKKLLNQFNNILIYILLTAAAITGLLQHWVDTSVIIGVVLINAVIGYIQEDKAEKSIAALKKMLSLKANVIRDGKRMCIAASKLVPGDIVLLNSGDKVPADIRITNANTLQIDEAILTGESMPVDKNVKSLAAKTILSERSSMAYSGTLVTYGLGSGVVVSTGINTEVGRISSMLQVTPRFSTPLIRQLELLGNYLAKIIISFSLLIFLFGIFVRQYPFEEMFMAAVAIAIAVIPEGLPAIISIILAIGVTRMARRNAIIRRLASVETLSSATAICTDKTGTLTRNELSVQIIVDSQSQYTVTGSGYNDMGNILQDNSIINLENYNDLQMLLQAGLLCNEAELSKDNDTWQLIGNPMDGALLALGLKANLNYKYEILQNPRLDSIPFNSEYKFMATLNNYGENDSCIWIKGAPEIVLSMCNRQLQNQNNEALDKNYWQEQINNLAKKGMRVLAVAYRKVDKSHSKLQFKDVKNNLTFIGLIGIIDPPREKAKDAILACQQAGIRVKMVTGDHALTAQFIASQVGIKGTKVLTGKDIDLLSDEQLAELVEDIDIYARTSPEHKIRLIKALRARKHIIAMTGDGVNDAPALQNADIGIAMGIRGTDVAKEAAEMVLADDNFASIENAVEEARNVYNNLKKALLFILPNDGGEGFAIFFAILFGYTLPITPVQILWVNMVTAVTLALALAFEPAEKLLMKQQPRSPYESLLSGFLIWRIAFVSLLFVCSIFGLFIYEINQGASIPLARTMAVDVLVFLEAIYLINCRRIYDSVLSKEGILGSKPILLAIGLVTILQLGFTYMPFMQYFFKTQALDLAQWALISTIALSVFFIIETEKLVIRKIYYK